MRSRSELYDILVDELRIDKAKTTEILDNAFALHDETKKKNEKIEELKEKFVGKLLYINSDDNNTLYSVDTSTYEAKRLSLINAKDLKVTNNQLFFINLGDSNWLYKLTVNIESSEIKTEPIISSSINDFYLVENYLFYQKGTNVNNPYFITINQNNVQ